MREGACTAGVGALARVELVQSSPTWGTARAIAEALDVSLRAVGDQVERQR